MGQVLVILILITTVLVLGLIIAVGVSETSSSNVGQVRVYVTGSLTNNINGNTQDSPLGIISKEVI